MTEIWKDIEGYEGQYQVSNLGNVRSVDRIVTYTNKYGTFSHKQKGKLISSYFDKKGYVYVPLYKNAIKKIIKIHRLVAELFIPNPDNLPCVNHKDENKANNNVENLEWCTIAYNNTYGTHVERVTLKIRGKKRTPETCQKIREWHLGRPRSEETKRKISEAAARKRQMRQMVV